MIQYAITNVRARREKKGAHKDVRTNGNWILNYHFGFFLLRSYFASSTQRYIKLVCLLYVHVIVAIAVAIAIIDATMQSSLSCSERHTRTLDAAFKYDSYTRPFFLLSTAHSHSTKGVWFACVSVRTRRTLTHCANNSDSTESNEFESYWAGFGWFRFFWMEMKGNFERKKLCDERHLFK